MLLEVVTAPNDILRFVCEPVEQVTKKHQKLIKDMKHTMNLLNGVGLAANQVGEKCRIIIAKNITTGEDVAYINPRIVGTTKKLVSSNEGCLSIPDVQVLVSRPENIILEYMTEEGKETKELINYPLSIIIQHEIDHLNGILIIDYPIHT